MRLLCGGLCLDSGVGRTTPPRPRPVPAHPLEEFPPSRGIASWPRPAQPRLTHPVPADPFPRLFVLPDCVAL